MNLLQLSVVSSCSIQIASLASMVLHGDPKYLPKAAGSFKRGGSRVMNWVQEGGPFLPESGRYHLFINYGCGWSHRAMLVRSLKGLEDCISMSHTGMANR